MATGVVSGAGSAGKGEGEEEEEEEEGPSVAGEASGFRRVALRLVSRGAPLAFSSFAAAPLLTERTALPRVVSIGVSAGPGTAWSVPSAAAFRSASGLAVALAFFVDLRTVRFPDSPFVASLSDSISIYLRLDDIPPTLMRIITQ
jgi:hypothetical protein